MNFLYRSNITLFSLTISLLLAACSQNNPVPNLPAPDHDANLEVTFTVKIENISQNTTLPGDLSGLVWAVSKQAPVIFAEGQKASAELEQLAEDGQTTALLNALSSSLQKGTVNSPLKAGESSSFSFKASPGSQLSFASALMQANDLFIAPVVAQLALFDAKNEPIAPGQVEIALWDAGSEVNQEPGKGAEQLARQASAGQGQAENQSIRHLDEVKDGFVYPEASQLFKVSLSHNHEHEHDTADGKAADSDHGHEADNAH